MIITRFCFQYSNVLKLKVAINYKQQGQKCLFRRGCILYRDYRCKNMTHLQKLLKNKLDLQ